MYHFLHHFAYKKTYNYCIKNTKGREKNAEKNTERLQKKPKGRQKRTKITHKWQERARKDAEKNITVPPIEYRSDKKKRERTKTTIKNLKRTWDVRKKNAERAGNRET